MDLLHLAVRQHRLAPADALNAISCTPYPSAKPFSFQLFWCKAMELVRQISDMACKLSFSLSAAFICHRWVCEDSLSLRCPRLSISNLLFSFLWICDLSIFLSFETDLMFFFHSWPQHHLLELLFFTDKEKWMTIGDFGVACPRVNLYTTPFYKMQRLELVCSINSSDQQVPITDLTQVWVVVELQAPDHSSSFPASHS